MKEDGRHSLIVYDSKLGAMVALLLMKKMMKREVSLESSNEGEGLDVGLTRGWGCLGGAWSRLSSSHESFG